MSSENITRVLKVYNSVYFVEKDQWQPDTSVLLSLTTSVLNRSRKCHTYLEICDQNSSFETDLLPDMSFKTEKKLEKYETIRFELILCSVQMWWDFLAWILCIFLKLKFSAALLVMCKYILYILIQQDI